VVINTLADTRLPREARAERASEHFPSLIARDTALVFASGYASLPTAYLTALSVRATTTSPAVTDRYCRLLFDDDEFSRWDSSNFVYTPNQERPIALAADKIYIKPTALTAGKIDYIKTHPTFGASQATVFSPTGDNVLIELVLYNYYNFIEEFDLASLHLNKAEAYGGYKQS
jgi:hypothetical protein